ncbi:MAG: mechanosensitive ion channel [Woeseiaceae bacterium]|nr:mechanosensitive ion channel [Woeseiaceae bacterium]
MLNDLLALHPLVLPGLKLLGLFVVAIAADLIVKRTLVASLRAFARRTKARWDDALVDNNVIGRTVQLLPALIIFSGVGLIAEMPERLVELIRNAAMAYMILMLTLALSSLLSAVSAIYSTFEVAKERPIKGFVQLAQIIIWVLGLVMIIAVLMDRSPLLLLSGFGAMTAILLLVFKDTILSFVASIQLTAQDMVRVGDWIEMQQLGADGDVIDVQLHTVTVQNWDKTITTIPTHRLISESFRNWRGMSESGGRRIKRSLFIDASSVRFQTPEEIAHFKRFALLGDYIEQKERELADYNAGLPGQVDDDVNRRRLTNIGTFRAYVLNYLKYRDDIRPDMTLLVRQLAPGPDGIPLEIYCFTATTQWAAYEGIQSDIFDHLFAIIEEFGLKLFQHPAGSDFGKLGADAIARG